MSNPGNYGVGIDLGGTQVKLCAYAPEGGKLLGEWEAPSRDGEREEGHPAFAVETRNVLRKIESEMEGGPEFLGVATAGLVNRENTKVVSLPQRLAGIEGFEWDRFLERPGGVPVLNDGHAALVGEFWQGAARGKKNVVMLTLGTGVGGAVLADGRLLRGHIGRAGHLGHMTLDLSGAPDICGTPGSLEELVGTCSLARRSQDRFKDYEALLEARSNGDAAAEKLWDETVHALALGIVSLINVFDPEVVVLGGGLSQSGDALFGGLSKAMEAHEWRPGGHAVPIAPAQLGPYAGACGAARFALKPQDF